MISGIDHIVILVDDLDEAMQEYAALGFAVSAGGKHPRYTHNALFGIGDGSYVELISFYELDAADAHRWFKYRQHGGGLIDYAVATDDLDAEMKALSGAGINYTGPNAGARARPDGIEIAWKTATPASGSASALPFIIEDISDRSLRVPNDPNSNGVTGIATLIIAVADLNEATARHTTLFGREPEALASAPAGVEGVVFTIGSQRIELHAPAGDTDLAAQLAGRGEGPREVIFKGSSPVTIDPASAGNARLSIQAG